MDYRRGCPFFEDKTENQQENLQALQYVCRKLPCAGDRQEHQENRLQYMHRMYVLS